MFKSSSVAKKLQSSDILYSLNDDERQQLKKCLMSILVDFVAVCEKHGLCYMLSGGTVLGAVRHKGFIPWDDDLDIMMPRCDYNKFIEIFEDELSHKYVLRVPNSKYEVSNTFMKIVKKNTTLIDIYNLETPFLKGVYIDVFPIENAPNNTVIRGIKGFLSDAMAYIGVSMYMYEHKNDLIKSYFYSSNEGKVNYIFRLFLGFCFKLIGYKRWYNRYDRFVQHKAQTGVCTIPTGRKHYRGEAHDQSVFFPVCKGQFEGETVNLPNDTVSYLENLYGDYMKIPSVEDRERHYFVEFKIIEKAQKGRDD
jgi:lipopolysaccharide cholinephosphotransferase